MRRYHGHLELLEEPSMDFPARPHEDLGPLGRVGDARVAAVVGQHRHVFQASEVPVTLLKDGAT